MNNSSFGNIAIAVVVFFIAVPVLIGTCDSKNTPESTYEYTQEGLEKVIKQLREYPDYTILLYDMDYANGDYVHKYQVLVEKPDSTFEEEITNWLEVSPTFFQKHENDLGMEIASKEDGVVQKEVAPAGYSQYVGNPQYGNWVQRDGGSFWEFYGKYAMLSTVFNMMSRPAMYRSWNEYDSRYRGRSGPYYGAGGYYGTRSYTQTGKGSQTSWGRKPQSFKERVRSRVSQSSSRASRSSGSNRVSRSSSRYSGSSGYRSRGGGFGGK
jgi:hypothetical protein